MRDPQDKKIAEAFEALADIAVLIEPALEADGLGVPDSQREEERGGATDEDAAGEAVAKRGAVTD